VVFEQPNPIVEWDVRGRYLAYSTADAPVGQARVVDVEANCFAKITHPEFGEQGSLVFPSTDGERSIFCATRYGSVIERELFLLDISSGNWERHLFNVSPPDPSRNYKYSTLEGSLVSIYIQEGATPTSKGQAFLYDLSDKTITGLSEPQMKIWHTRMSGDHVVWTEETSLVADILVHRISTGETWNLTNHPNGQFRPRIDGTRVVWTDLRHGGGQYYASGTWNHADIFMYDFATDELTAITNQDWLQLYPDIDGDRIVWQDSRDCSQPNNAWDWGGIDIWMYDISTGQQHQITNLPGPEGDPRIDGNRVFFMAYHPEGYSTIFMQDLAALGL